MTKEQIEAIFAKFDNNGDGKMSKEEFISYDRSIPIRNAIKKEDLNEPKGNNSFLVRSQ